MDEQKLEPQQELSDVDLYGEPGIASGHAPPPRWLIVTNTFFTILGLIWLYLFWNGSYGWLDRGYWSQLQRAANTTYPYTTKEIVDKEVFEKQTYQMKDRT